MADDALIQADVTLDGFDAFRPNLEVIERVKAVSQIGAVVTDRVGEPAPAPGGFVADAQNASTSSGDVACDSFGMFRSIPRACRREPKSTSIRKNARLILGARGSPFLWSRPDSNRTRVAQASSGTEQKGICLRPIRRTGQYSAGDRNSQHFRQKSLWHAYRNRVLGECSNNSPILEIGTRADLFIKQPAALSREFGLENDE